MRLKGFINGSYTNRSFAADAQRCVNLFPEINEERTAANGEIGVLFGTPGLTALNSIGGGQITATGMSFGTGDGVTSSFTLKYNGSAVTSVIGTPTIWRTDWQGMQQMYPVSRLNLLTYSESFVNAAWVKIFISATAGISDPAGRTTASTLTCNSASGGTFSQSVTGLSPSMTYVNSIWLRRRTGSGAVSLSAPNVAPQLVVLSSTWQRYSFYGNPLPTGIGWFIIALATLGDQIDIAFAQMEASVTPNGLPASYLSRASIGLAIPDYSISGVSVVFSPPPLPNAGLTWSGQAILLTGFAEGPIRGLYRASNGVLYCVCANFLYSIDSSWNPTPIGEINTSTGRVQMNDNGYQLIVVDGQGYVLTFSSGVFTYLQGINGWQGATSAAVIDGWGVFNVPGTNQFYTSNQNDFTSYNGTVTSPSPNYSFKAAQGDPIISILSDHEVVWLFGQKTTEIWYNAQNPPPGIVLGKYAGTLIEVGCCGPQTPQQIMNSIIWLGDGRDGSGIVWQCQGGFVPNRISTHAVEDALQSYGYLNLQQATAWTYEQEGHGFYCLNVPSAPVTWVYDVVTGLWHERSRMANGIEMRHLADCHAFAYGKHVVGDYQNSNLYMLDLDNPTDNGMPKRWLRRTPHFAADLKRVFYNSVQLDMQVGIGQNTSTVQPPQISMRWSDDAGYTWSHYHNASAGDLGAYLTRVLWWRCGASRARVFEFSSSDPGPAAILGVELGVQVGVS